MLLDRIGITTEADEEFQETGRCDGGNRDVYSHKGSGNYRGHYHNGHGGVG